MFFSFFLAGKWMGRILARFRLKEGGGGGGGGGGG